MKLNNVKQVEKKIQEITESYIPVAEHGATLFFTVADLPNIDPMYEFSLEWICRLFVQAIEEAEKSRLVSDRMRNL
jgi:dynein heavy chain